MRKRQLVCITIIMAMFLCSCGSTQTQDDLKKEAEKASAEIGSQTMEENISLPEPTEEPTPEPTPEPEPAWFIESTLDEFGDVTEDSKDVLSGLITGDFSNTATSSSDLSGVVRFSKTAKGHYLTQFVLFEYNDTPITYYGNDAKILKTKVDNTVSEYELTGESPNGSLFLGVGEYDYNGDLLFNDLYNGNDVRCIIQLGQSKYNFVLPHDNFKELCSIIGYEEGPGKMRVQDAVAVFVGDRGEKEAIKNAALCLVDSREDIEMLDADRLNELIEGNFVYIDASTAGVPMNDKLYPLWYVYSFTPDTVSCLVDFSYTTKLGGYRKFSKYNKPDKNKRYTEDNLLVWYSNYKKEKTGFWEIHRVTDNVFVFYTKKDDGSYSLPALLLRCDKVSEQSVYDSLNAILKDDLLMESD